MMKYTVKYSTLFKKSFKKCMKWGCDSEEFKTSIKQTKRKRYGNEKFTNISAI